MSLFTNFAPLVKAGAVVHLTLRAVGENMQLEIIPVCDAGKTGLTIPPRAFVATPEELDKEIPAVIENYVASAVRLSDQIAVTKVVMEEAERSAKEVKTTPAKPASSKPATKPSAGGKPRDMNAGMLDVDDDTEGGEGGSPGETPPAAGDAPVEATGDKPADGTTNLFM